MFGIYVLKKNIDHVPRKSQINKLIIFDFFLSPFTLNYNVNTLLLQEFKIRTRDIAYSYSFYHLSQVTNTLIIFD